MRVFQSTLKDWEQNSLQTFRVIKSKLNQKKKAFCVRLQAQDQATSKEFDIVKLSACLDELVLSGYLKEYYLVGHYPDYTSGATGSFSHFHMVLICNSRQSIRTILELVYNSFNDDYSLSPYLYNADDNTFFIDPAIMVEGCNSIHSSVRYLAHLDNPEKGTYPLSSIVTNNEEALMKFAVLTPDLTVAQLEELLRLHDYNYVATLKSLDIATANRCRNILRDLVRYYYGYDPIA